MRELQVGRTLVRIVVGDLTRHEADVVVNPANTSLLGGGGVDGAIHRAGGPKILEQCRAIVARQGGCRVGEAVVTTGGALRARYVVHTVGPVWQGGQRGEATLLARCWTRSLELVAQQGCRSVAFPAISAGTYRVPMEVAASVAFDAVGSFLIANPDVLDRVDVVLTTEAVAAVWEAQLGRWVAEPRLP